MAEPTSNYSFHDLILRVAKAAGIAYHGAAGDERALIPINEHDLIRCKDVVNQGIKNFISDAPPNGWRWMRRIMSVAFATVQTEGTVDTGSTTTLIDATLSDTYTTNNEIIGYYIYDQTQEIYAAITGYSTATGTVFVAAWLDYNNDSSSLTPVAGDAYSITNLKTVDGDKRRYPLSQDFMGNVTGKITYDKDSGRGHIIDWDSEASVRFQGEVTVTTGHPTRAAVRPWGSRRWELIVDPSPTAADTVIFPYELGFDALQLEAGDINTPAADSIIDDSIGALWPDDYFNGWTVHIMGGRGRGNYAEVDDYTGASGKFDIVDDEWVAPDGTIGIWNFGN